MGKNANRKRMDDLMRYYLNVDPVVVLTDDVLVAKLTEADWRIVDLAIALDPEFGISLSADEALALKTVGDWHRLVRADT